MTYINVKEPATSASFPKGARCDRTEQEARDDRAKNLSMWAVILKGAEPKVPAK